MSSEIPAVNTAAPSEQSKSSENNLAQMRKLLEQQRVEKDKILSEKRKLEEEREVLLRGRQSQDDDEEESGEPYIDPRTLNRKLSKLESKIESMVEKKADERARKILDEERKEDYLKQNSDFEKVLTPEIVQKFIDKSPQLAKIVAKLPDGFEKQQMVYEMIKATGLHKDPEPQKSIQEKIDSNRRSPFFQPTGVSTPAGGLSGDYSPSGQKNAYNHIQDLKKRLRLG